MNRQINKNKERLKMTKAIKVDNTWQITEYLPLDNGYTLRISTTKGDGCVCNRLRAGVGDGEFSFTTAIFEDYDTTLNHKDLKKATSKNIEMAHLAFMRNKQFYLQQVSDYYKNRELVPHPLNK